MTTDQKNEVWKDVSGYDGYYQVSSLGRVKSLARDNRGKKFGRLIPGCILKPHIHYKNKYHSVLFKIGKHQKRFTIHSLVANAFIGKPKGYSEINHKDCNKSHNDINNLEWSTRAMNCMHAVSNGLREHSSLQHRTIAIQDLAIIDFKSLLSCAKYLNVSHRTIRRKIDTNKPVKGYLIYSVPQNGIAL